MARQRAMGAGGGVVMEGRDIGTVVFPRADVKVYLDAVAGRARPTPGADAAHAAGRATAGERDGGDGRPATGRTARGPRRRSRWRRTRS